MEMTSWQTSLRDLLFVVFKRRWSVLVIVAGGVMGVLFWMILIREETYEATARILVKIGHEQSNASNVALPSLLITGERIQDVNSEVEILTSTDLLQQLIDDFGLDQPKPPNPPPPRLVPRIRYEIRRVMAWFRGWKDRILIMVGFKEQFTLRESALVELRQRLVVEPGRNSNVITVRLRVGQRQNAGALLNGLLNRYLTFRLGIYRQSGAEGFFQRAVEQKSEALREAEQDLRAFENQWDISAIEKQKEVLLTQIAEAQADSTNAEIEFREASERVLRSEAEMNSDEPDVATIGSFSANSFPANLLAQLAELQREREGLRMTELDSGMRISNNRKQFNVLMEMLTVHLKSALSEKRDVYEKRTSVLKELEAKVSSLKAKETEWTSLKRKVQVSEHSFFTFREKMENAVATASLEEQNIVSVAVLERPIDPLMPLGMSKLRILGLTIILTLFAAVAWLSVAEYLDHHVFTAADIEKHVGSPVLEAIPAMKQASLFPLHPGNSGPDEPYRKAAWVLANPTGHGPLGTVFFSGTARGDGTTSTVLAIAQQLSANYGLRTLVLELERSHPVCVNEFDLDSERTLEAYLEGKLGAKECVQPHNSGVFFLPAHPSGGRHKLSQKKLTGLLDEVSPDFDLILVDSPPVLASDSLPIRGVIKKAVLVVESGQRCYELLARVRQELAAENVELVGAVLSKQKRYIPSWIYRWLL